MILGHIDITDEDKVLLQVEFEDVNEALNYCIDHEIKISPRFIERVPGEKSEL